MTDCQRTPIHQAVSKQLVLDSPSDRVLIEKKKNDVDNYDEDKIAELEREAAEELLTNLLKSKLGAKSLQEYLKAGQFNTVDSVDNVVTAPFRDVIPTSSYMTTTAAATSANSPVTTKRNSPDTLPRDTQYSPQTRSDCKRSRNNDKSNNDHINDPSGPPSKQHQSPPPPLFRRMGRGKGTPLYFVRGRSYVSQVLELQQALGWAPPRYEHTREGPQFGEVFFVSCFLNGDEYQAAEGTLRIQQGKELAALQALQSLLPEK